MNLPETLSNAQSWTVVGPMGPAIPTALSSFPILAVDGGAAFTDRIDVWTGDHDSHLVPVKCEHQEILSKDKDISDLTAAFNILSRTKSKEFHLWGFLGGRLDHEIFNIGEALSFLGRRPGHELFFYNNEGRVLIKVFSRGTFNFTYSGTFSIGTLFTPEVVLTGDCRYPIPEPTLLSPLSSLGLSNVGEGTMRLKTSAPLFVIFPEVK